MSERIRKELALVEAKWGDLEVAPNLDWFIIKRWLLPGGWNKAETQLLVLIPSGYATTPLDNFYTDSDLRLANGNTPGNASLAQTAAGRSWVLFSYHIESGDWQPHADPLQGHNLLTFLFGVEKRLAEIS